MGGAETKPSKAEQDAQFVQNTLEYLDRAQEEYVEQAEMVEQSKREADEAEAEMRAAASQLEAEIREMEEELKMLQSQIIEYGDDPAVQAAVAAHKENITKSKLLLERWRNEEGKLL